MGFTTSRSSLPHVWTIPSQSFLEKKIELNYFMSSQLLPLSPATTPVLTSSDRPGIIPQDSHALFHPLNNHRGLALLVKQKRKPGQRSKMIRSDLMAGKQCGTIVCHFFLMFFIDFLRESTSRGGAEGDRGSKAGSAQTG